MNAGEFRSRDLSTLETLDKAGQLIRTKRELVSLGMSDRQIQTAARSGTLIRISRGFYIYACDWDPLTFVEKHLAQAYCAHHTARNPPIFSHVTAAAMLGLPILRADVEQVHSLQQSDGCSSSGRMRRHRQGFTVSDTQLSGDFIHTNLARTVIDVAQNCSTEQAVVIGDAALRRAKLAEGANFSLRRKKKTLLKLLQMFPGTRGKRRARVIIEFWDDSAESPLESLYRVQLARLGFEIKTQVPVHSKSGSTYRMDFELIGHGAFFEADGEMKYTDEQYRNGKHLDTLLLREKQREEWVRGTTGRRVLHGGWADALTLRRTAALLRAYGVTPPVDKGSKPRLLL